MAVFIEDKHDYTVRRYDDVLRLLRKSTDENLEIVSVGKIDVLKKIESKTPINCDVAVVHMSYEIDGSEKFQRWYTTDIIQQLLPVDTRRVIISKERSGSVSGEVIGKFQGDHYYPFHLITEGRFFQTLKLGKVSDEERLLRGFSVEIEGTERVEVKVESLPVRGFEGSDYRDDYHKRKEE